ncbi:unnamed protein product [Calicophoron daubneyi]|uniref:Uncharacterized protein n=1 Tax=Calicophoron daubneyi TaxID=300641 RepID=A0AAV2TMK5_CALDB
MGNRCLKPTPNRNDEETSIADFSQYLQKGRQKADCSRSVGTEVDLITSSKGTQCELSTQVCGLESQPYTVSSPEQSLRCYCSNPCISRLYEPSGCSARVSHGYVSPPVYYNGLVDDMSFRSNNLLVNSNMPKFQEDVSKGICSNALPCQSVYWPQQFSDSAQQYFVDPKPDVFRLPDQPPQSPEIVDNADKGHLVWDFGDTKLRRGFTPRQKYISQPTSRNVTPKFLNFVGMNEITTQSMVMPDYKQLEAEKTNTLNCSKARSTSDLVPLQLRALNAHKTELFKSQKPSHPMIRSCSLTSLKAISFPNFYVDKQSGDNNGGQDSQSPSKNQEEFDIDFHGQPNMTETSNSPRTNYGQFTSQQHSLGCATSVATAAYSPWYRCENFLTPRPAQTSSRSVPAYYNRRLVTTHYQPAFALDQPNTYLSAGAHVSGPTSYTSSESYAEHPRICWPVTNSTIFSINENCSSPSFVNVDQSSKNDGPTEEIKPKNSVKICMSDFRPVHSPVSRVPNFKFVPVSQDSQTVPNTQHIRRKSSPPKTVTSRSRSYMGKRSRSNSQISQRNLCKAEMNCSNTSIFYSSHPKDPFKHRFFLKDSYGLDKILEDPTDRRIRAICDRFQCDMEVYSKILKNGFLQYVIDISSPSLWALHSCTRALDSSLNWCLSSQLQRAPFNCACP